MVHHSILLEISTSEIYSKYNQWQLQRRTVNCGYQTLFFMVETDQVYGSTIINLLVRCRSTNITPGNYESPPLVEFKMLVVMEMVEWNCSD